MRQVQRQLDSGRMVVIPNKYVSDGWRDYIAFYACDTATGEYVGITEDGLCGSTNLNQSPANSLWPLLRKSIRRRKPPRKPSPPRNRKPNLPRRPLQ